MGESVNQRGLNHLPLSYPVPDLLPPLRDPRAEASNIAVSVINRYRGEVLKVYEVG